METMLTSEREITKGAYSCCSYSGLYKMKTMSSLDDGEDKVTLYAKAAFQSALVVGTCAVKMTRNSNSRSPSSLTMSRSDLDQPYFVSLDIVPRDTVGLTPWGAGGLVQVPRMNRTTPDQTTPRLIFPVEALGELTSESKHGQRLGDILT